MSSSNYKCVSNADLRWMLSATQDLVAFIALFLLDDAFTFQMQIYVTLKPVIFVRVGVHSSSGICAISLLPQGFSAIVGLIKDLHICGCRANVPSLSSEALQGNSMIPSIFF